jgi:hypothetical protein
MKNENVATRHFHHKMGGAISPQSWDLLQRCQGAGFSDRRRGGGSGPGFLGPDASIVPGRRDAGQNNEEQGRRTQGAAVGEKC